jgi:hypothetical protein
MVQKSFIGIGAIVATLVFGVVTTTHAVEARHHGYGLGLGPLAGLDYPGIAEKEKRLGLEPGSGIASELVLGAIGGHAVWDPIIRHHQEENYYKALKEGRITEDYQL